MTDNNNNNNNKLNDRINDKNIENNIKIDENIEKVNKNNNKLLGMLFMGSLTGFSVLFGFSTALAIAKKKDTNAFNKGISILKSTHSESGGSLAMRALGWGTLYACSGFTLFCVTVWKALGVNDLQEFRLKVGNLLPTIPKNNPPKSRTEFSSLHDLLEYIIQESDKSQNKNNDRNDDAIKKSK